MKIKNILLLMVAYLLLLGCMHSSVLEVDKVYISNLSRLSYNCHDGYIIVIPCGKDKIDIQQVYWLLVDYNDGKNASKYKTFKDYLIAIYTTLNLHNCKKNEGYTYKETDVYQDYLKNGFEEFMKKYTYEEYSYTYSNIYDKCIFIKKEIQDEWRRKTGCNLQAAVKILFDHQYYIQQYDMSESHEGEYYFFKTYQECKPFLPIPPPR